MKSAATALTLCVSVMLVMGAEPNQVQSADDSAKVTDLEIQLLRKNLRDQKKQLVAANLSMTGDQAANFWPIYGSYTEETIKINDQRYDIIKEYMVNYNAMTDSAAASFIRRWIGVDEAGVKLRTQWIPKFEKVLGEKKAATFFQIDRRVAMMQELQISSQMPLVAP